MKTQEEVHSELCMLYSRRDVHSHSWARGELASQSLLDDIWGKIYALRWVLDKNIQWGVAEQPHEKGEAGPFEKWPLMCYCYPGCEIPKAAPAPLADAELADLVDLEQQATPAPWTAWLDHGKIFYGEAIENSSFSFSPANLTICDCEQFDREDEQDVTPGTAEDDARFIAAMRNALPGLLARLTTVQEPDYKGRIRADIERLEAQKNRNKLGRDGLLIAMQEQPSRRQEFEAEYAAMKRRYEDYDVRIQALDWVLAGA